MLYWDVDLSETNVLFWWQKRTRKPPAISTRWIHEKGATRPFQTPKEKSKRKKASRFAKTGCGSQRLLRCRSHPAGRCPNSSSGCDQVGASLVRDLERIGHDISIIEKDSEQLKRLDAFDDYTFSGNALVGDPTDPDVLRQGGIENCDAVAAVSEDDSLNLMAAQIAKSLFQREKVICRVSDPHLQVLYHKAYELDTICPTVLTEQAVFRSLAK